MLARVAQFRTAMQTPLQSKSVTGSKLRTAVSSMRASILCLVTWIDPTINHYPEGTRTCPAAFSSAMTMNWSIVKTSNVKLGEGRCQTELLISNGDAADPVPGLSSCSWQQIHIVICQLLYEHTVESSLSLAGSSEE